jgi:hypothetical protein
LIGENDVADQRERLRLRTAPVSLTGLDALKADVLVLNLFEDEKQPKGTAGYCDWRLNSRISRLLLANEFAGLCDEVLLMDSVRRIGTERIVLFGLGRREAMTLSVFSDQIERIFTTIKKAAYRDIAIDLPDLENSSIVIPTALTKFFDVWESIYPNAKVILLTASKKLSDMIVRTAEKNKRIKVET